MQYETWTPFYSTIVSQSKRWKTHYQALYTTQNYLVAFQWISIFRQPINKISRQYIARTAGEGWVCHTRIVGLSPFTLPFNKPVRTKTSKKSKKTRRIRIICSWRVYLLMAHGINLGAFPINLDCHIPYTHYTVYSLYRIWNGDETNYSQFGRFLR